MRIAMLNWTARLAGGVERYLARVIPALGAAGHQIVLVAEADGPADRAPIGGAVLPADPARLASWRPDVIVNHGWQDPDLERRLVRTAPSVLFAHSYYGTCISGSKTYTFPRVAPCARRLDAGCLLRYYPRRTGGLDPRTMLREWRRQRARQSLFDAYRAVLVFSDHMRAEYAREVGDRVRVLPFPMEPAVRHEPAPDRRRTRVTFVGRCDPLKGGGVLITAMRDLPGLTLTVVGDGPARGGWEQAAAPLEDRVKFTGWIHDVSEAYADSDLIVVPSLWPEPFGQVGLEAARYAVPATAFPVGGIPTWLVEGVNGTLAARVADPEALAEAIRRALDPARYADLAAGAVRAVARHSVERHATALLAALEAAA